MILELVALTTGSIGLFLNNRRIITADPRFECVDAVLEAAEGLERALAVKATRIEREAPVPGPKTDGWSLVSKTLPSAAAVAATAAAAQSLSLGDALRAAQTLADEAFTSYNFGELMTVVGTDGWGWSTGEFTLRRKVYVKNDCTPELPAICVKFTVIVEDGVVVTASHGACD